MSLRRARAEAWSGAYHLLTFIRRIGCIAALALASASRVHPRRRRVGPKLGRAPDPRGHAGGRARPLASDLRAAMRRSRNRRSPPRSRRRTQLQHPPAPPPPVAQPPHGRVDRRAGRNDRRPGRDRHRRAGPVDRPRRLRRRQHRRSRARHRLRSSSLSTHARLPTGRTSSRSTSAFTGGGSAIAVWSVTVANALSRSPAIVATPVAVPVVQLVAPRRSHARVRPARQRPLSRRRARPGSHRQATRRSARRLPRPRRRGSGDPGNARARRPSAALRTRAPRPSPACSAFGSTTLQARTISSCFRPSP